jgi:hypothetical protein
MISSWPRAESYLSGEKRQGEGKAWKGVPTNHVPNIIRDVFLTCSINSWNTHSNSNPLGSRLQSLQMIQQGRLHVKSAPAKEMGTSRNPGSRLLLFRGQVASALTPMLIMPMSSESRMQPFTIKPCRMGAKHHLFPQQSIAAGPTAQEKDECPVPILRVHNGCQDTIIVQNYSAEYEFLSACAHHAMATLLEARLQRPQATIKANLTLLVNIQANMSAKRNSTLALIEGSARSSRS